MHSQQSVLSYFDTLQQVLCPPAPTCGQLPQEEVRPHQPAATKEEDQVMGLLCFDSDVAV